jgi:mRNA interferase MazF
VTIRQGDVYWVDLGELKGSGPGFRHPHVVVQNNVFNGSRIGTVVVCALTSNMKRAAAPGNVLLEKGEANLKKDRVVNVTQLVTVDKADLIEQIGDLVSHQGPGNRRWHQTVDRTTRPPALTIPHYRLSVVLDSASAPSGTSLVDFYHASPQLSSSKRATAIGLLRCEDNAIISHSRKLVVCPGDAMKTLCRD